MYSVRLFYQWCVAFVFINKGLSLPCSQGLLPNISWYVGRLKDCYLSKKTLLNRPGVVWGSKLRKPPVCRRDFVGLIPVPGMCTPLR